MTTLKLAIASIFVCLLTGAASASTTELLYVQEGKNIVTYSVSNTTAVTKKLGTLATKFGSVVSVNRSGSFLYVLGFTSGTAESFSVHALTSAGVPTATPVQTLTVKPALSQFYIHPNGTVAYAMFSWTEVVDSTTEFASDIVLFAINPKTGKLTNTAKNIANFPLNEGTSTSIKYVNSKGTELYTEDFWAGFCHTCVEPSYYYSNINAKTGLLSPRVYFWADDDTDAGSFFSDSILVYDPFGVYSMGPKPSLLAPCDPSTLAVCGDYIYPVYIHPSDKYIFLADQTLNEVPILYISVPKAELEPSGASIPGIPTAVAFSPDGLLVYAVEGNEILVYVFNPHSGLLTARTSISTPGVGKILPVQ